MEISVLIWLGVIAALVLRVRAIWDGVEINFDTGTVTFPGGGISPNEFSDVFHPRWLLQFWQRFTVNISDIRMIKTRDRAWRKNGQWHRQYYIDFNGHFGAVSLAFPEGKRDELYSFFRQHNQMGIPVVRG